MIETTFINIAVRVGLGIWVGLTCLLVLYVLYLKYKRMQDSSLESIDVGSKDGK